MIFQLELGGWSRCYFAASAMIRLLLILAADQEQIGKPQRIPEAKSSSQRRGRGGRGGPQRQGGDQSNSAHLGVLSVHCVKGWLKIASLDTKITEKIRPACVIQNLNHGLRWPHSDPA